MSIRLNGSTSGYTELDAGAVAGNNTLKMPVSNGAANQLLRNGATPGTLEFGGAIVSGTAQASTSGTSIDFTGIPSWAKRVTVLLNGLSTSGASNPLIQIGAGSVLATGYSACSGITQNATTGLTAAYTTGLGILSANSANVLSGAMVISLISGNTWIGSHAISGVQGATSFTICGGGTVALSGALDRVRLTTVNGTDQFDAGTVNILYE